MRALSDWCVNGRIGRLDLHRVQPVLPETGTLPRRGLEGRWVLPATDKVTRVIQVVALPQHKANFCGSFSRDIKMDLQGGAAVVTGSMLPVTKIPVQKSEGTGGVGVIAVKIVA